MGRLLNSSFFQQLTRSKNGRASVHCAFVSVSDKYTGQLQGAIATKSYQDRALCGNMPEQKESIRSEAATDQSPGNLSDSGDRDEGKRFRVTMVVGIVALPVQYLPSVGSAAHA
jgi:hypothetical protein